MYFVCCKPTPLCFFVYRTSHPAPPPPPVPRPTCTANFLYRYTSLISATSWYTGGGGAMFYKIISFLVDCIVKKMTFLPQNLQN